MRFSQQYIANRLQVSASTVQHILSGFRNASAPLADKFADLTGTPHRIWLQGGDVEARKKAIQDWIFEKTAKSPEGSH